MGYFNKSIDEVVEELEADINSGLSEEKVNEKQQKYGLNELQGKKKQSLFIKFLNQFKDFMIIVLITRSTTKNECTCF